MNYNPYLFWWNPIPEIDLRPPTIYSFLNSIVNYGKVEKTKITDLAKEGRSEIFDFEYPLTSNLTREFFETQILKHYMMRRIGYETMTAFKIQLDCKLNEIMPLYNRMFDLLENWDLFGSEITTRVGEDNLQSTNSQNTKTENASKTNLNTTSTSSSSGTEDRRRSDTPQNELQNVRDGSYVTNYEYNTNSNDSNDSSVSNETNEATGKNETSGTGTDKKNYNETISHSPTASEKIALYNNLQTNIFSIFGLIYKELDSLFYGIC